jgi:hypothetical protein
MLTLKKLKLFSEGLFIFSTNLKIPATPLIMLTSSILTNLRVIE